MKLRCYLSSLLRIHHPDCKHCCSGNARRCDAKAAGRIGLADAAVFAGSGWSFRFPAGRNYNLASFVEGEEEERLAGSGKTLFQASSFRSGVGRVVEPG